MDLTPEQEEQLARAAWEARRHAYAPYSRFAVGAAVLAEDGRIYTGCNVENAVFGATLCAERVAVGQAVAAGQRRILAVAVAAESRSPTTPCGTCRQVLAEFADDMPVVVDNGRQRWRFRLAELLPAAFSRAHLDGR
ncbi:MAG TPA: cytidine deaminase [Limnochordales bacterium]